MIMSALFETTLPALAFELTIKSLLLLTVVLTITWFMRRSSAAVRHLYFTIASVALILLSLAGLLLPSWHPGILPDRFESIFAPAVTTSTPSPGLDQPADSRTGGAVTSTTSAGGRAKSWHNWFFVVWLAGASILVLGLAGGKLYGFLTARRARMVTDEEFLAVLHEANQKVNLRREVVVLESRRFIVPSVTGIFRPKLLVPPQAAFWPRDRLRAVLQHELSHIKRNDILVQFLSQVACCFYWLNPLTWILERKLFIERERACDDMALSQDVKASDYAGHLMEVLEEMGNKRNTLWVTAAMAEGTDFKDRILSVLNPVARRSSPHKGHLFAAAALALAKESPYPR
jgi:beta-lactamase regulating signal transducer with metallopeptidase domain